jgi:uncharacterized membrane protein (DUF485 family)
MEEQDKEKHQPEKYKSNAYLAWIIGITVLVWYVAAMLLMKP